jgi:5'-nucleotidase
MTVRGIVIDTLRGNLIKLDYEHKVESAFHGTRALSQHEIQQTYEGVDIPWKDRDFSALMTYFEVTLSSTFAYIVDFVDSSISESS